MRIAFQRNDKSITAKLICWWTKSPFSHCELVFSDGSMFSSDPSDNGTRYLQNMHLTYNDWEVLDIQTSSVQEKIIRDFCDSELHCRYDWWGIFCSQVIRWQREDPTKWFCSEVCTAALQKIGFLTGNEPCTFSPAKLYKRLRESGAIICVP